MEISLQLGQQALANQRLTSNWHRQQTLINIAIVKYEPIPYLVNYVHPSGNRNPFSAMYSRVNPYDWLIDPWFTNLSE